MPLDSLPGVIGMKEVQFRCYLTVLSLFFISQLFLLNALLLNVFKELMFLSNLGDAFFLRITLYNYSTWQ